MWNLAGKFINTVADFRAAIRIGSQQPFDVAYWTSDGAALCHKCADVERRLIADSIGNDIRDTWHVVALEYTDVWDENQTCGHCGERFGPIPPEDDTGEPNDA